MSQPLILPMAAHVTLAAFLYVLLTVTRAPAVWGIGRRADGTSPWDAIESRISANLSNQFEWPLFFHTACLVLLLLQTTPLAIALAGCSLSAGCCIVRCKSLPRISGSGASFSR